MPRAAYQLKTLIIRWILSLFVTFSLIQVEPNSKKIALIATAESSFLLVYSKRVYDPAIHQHHDPDYDYELYLYGMTQNIPIVRNFYLIDTNTP